MKEILSQSEIDKLLDSVSTGEVEVDSLLEGKAEKVVKEYDFRRPNKFSKEHLRILQMIHDSFGRILSNFLAAYLSANIQIRVASVDQMTYEDFIRSVPSPTLLSIFTLEPLKGTALMETNSQFMFPVIDLLLGGPGNSPRNTRELTEIELSVLRKLNSKVIEHLALAWADIFEINPKLESLETNPRFNQSISPNETVAVITLATFVGTNKGLINLCIPFITLDPVISKLSAQYWFAHQEHRSDGNEKKALEFLLNSALVNLTAQFGETEITFRDFLQLQEDDVISLDRFIDQELDLLVEDELKFKIQPGITPNNRIGVQITRMVGEGEDDNGN